MKWIKWVLLMAMAGLILGQIGSAVEVGPYCAEFENRSTDWGPITKTVPQFNSSLGILTEVRVTGSACGYQTFMIDSDDSSEQDFEVSTSGDIITDLPVGPDFIVHLPPGGGERVRSDTLEPDEEIENPDPDYLGNDSYRDFISDCDSDIITFDQPADLAPWIGPGTVDITARADATTLAVGSGAFDTSIRTSVNATICVVYVYEPLRCIGGSKVGCDGEPLAGWTITLTKPDGTTATDTTDENGLYSFCNLAPGSYTVSEETKANWFPIGPTSYPVQLVDDDVEVPAFQNTEHFCISGYKYNVTVAADEKPLADWKITLTKPDGSTVTDTTDATGYYEFCDLANGQYKVSEELKSGWIAKSPTTITVDLYCEDESVDFRNARQPNLVCVCPFFIKNDLYVGSCKQVKYVDETKGLLANDPEGSYILNPESIKIDPKYGTIEVEEDGSFTWDPTGATALRSGIYVIFRYRANNGLCDSRYPGIAKIQVNCH